MSFIPELIQFMYELYIHKLVGHSPLIQLIRILYLSPPFSSVYIGQNSKLLRNMIHYTEKKAWLISLSTQILASEVCFD